MWFGGIHLKNYPTFHLDCFNLKQGGEILKLMIFFSGLYIFEWSFFLESSQSTSRFDSTVNGCHLVWYFLAVTWSRCLSIDLHEKIFSVTSAPLIDYLNTYFIPNLPWIGCPLFFQILLFHHIHVSRLSWTVLDVPAVHLECYTLQ
jgi:hypothetical protein